MDVSHGASIQLECIWNCNCSVEDVGCEMFSRVWVMQNCGSNDLVVTGQDIFLGGKVFCSWAKLRVFQKQHCF